MTDRKSPIEAYIGADITYSRKGDAEEIHGSWGLGDSFGVCLLILIATFSVVVFVAIRRGVPPQRILGQVGGLVRSLLRTKGR